MSEYKVCFTKIKEILPHPNPKVERLEIAIVYGFQVIVGKGAYNPGDFALFIPIDSILNQEIENIILGPDPKIKFDRHRVKQIRIQKFPSQGLLVSPSIVTEYLKAKGLKSDIAFKLEEDYQELLDIHKYEPPLPDYLANPRVQTRKEKPLENPLFHKYNGLENVKWFPDLFKEGEEVVIQEKLHGSNCRAGILKVVKPRLKHIKNELKAFNLRGALVLLVKFIKMTFNKTDVYEHVYGSNNVELTNRNGGKNYYGTNVYLTVLDKVKAFDKIRPNEIIYGELIGEGIQVNYDYGHKEKHFVLFDVKVIDALTDEFVWLDPYQVENYAKDRGFDIVPKLFDGPFNKQIAYELTKGDSVYEPKQLVREGIVIKAVNYNDKACAGNKKALKWISEKYLDKDQSDFH